MFHSQSPRPIHSLFFFRSSKYVSRYCVRYIFVHVQVMRASLIFFSYRKYPIHIVQVQRVQYSMPRIKLSECFIARLPGGVYKRKCENRPHSIMQNPRKVGSDNF